MEPPRLMSELERTARKLGLEVRIEPFETPPIRAGGLCWVKGRQVVLLDEKASLVEQVAALAAALSVFDLEGVYLAPEARRTIAAARDQISAAPGAGPEPGPGSTGGRRPAEPEDDR
jgi:hypothetical protein